MDDAAKLATTLESAVRRIGAQLQTRKERS